MKALAISLILVGIIWAMLMVWMYLISGIIAFLGFALAPVMVIVGSLIVLGGNHAKLGAIVALVGCAIVSLYIGYGITGLFHVEPLQAPPPYLLYAALGAVTLFADFAAICLYRLVSSAGIL
jgi:hypothetical protein